MSNNHKIGAAVALLALVACAGQAWAQSGGDNTMYTDPGRQATAALIAQAPLTLVIATGASGQNTTVTIGKWNQATPAWTEPGAAYQDTFVFPSVSVTGPSGSTSKLILPAGNPNPGGVVGNGNIPPGNNNSTLLAIYTNGTTAGATPTHPQMEAVWSQIQAGFFGTAGIPNIAPNNGITTTAPGALKTGQQRLAMLIRTDVKTAKFVGVVKDLTGDVNGDFTVNINDIIKMAAALDQTPASFGYGKFTWWEGDMNGDGVVNINDIIAAAANLDQGPYNPGGGDGFAAAPAFSGGTVPEPSTLALFLVGAAFCLLTGLRRLVK
jgi:hypothetical protein